ncbi:hypothetical protein [Acetobacter pomorum]|nr:hypothetical protein [Acetobacter pomorum]
MMGQHMLGENVAACLYQILFERIYLSICLSQKCFIEPEIPSEGESLA